MAQIWNAVCRQETQNAGPTKMIHLVKLNWLRIHSCCINNYLHKLIVMTLHLREQE